MKPAATEEGATVSGVTTLVAADTIFRGEIHGKGKSLVLGQVVGNCDISGPVTVAAGGHWRGKLSVASLIVAGTVEGDIVAKDRVEIEPTGKVTGTIACAALRVAAGAVIEGRVAVPSQSRHPMHSAVDAPTDELPKEASGQ